MSVAQLAPRKGFHVLIEACHYLTQQDVPFRCYIFGEGTERSRLESLIKEYNLGDRILMPGRIHQAELRQFLNRADVFVLPCVRDNDGDQDGIPVVLMEAMAMELPVISTSLSGIPELISHERNGLLVPPSDAVALADALQRLKNNRAMRKQLGKLGRETVIGDFNIHRSAERMAALLEEAA